jgi:regulator of nonsense transcripts 3
MLMTAALRSPTPRLNKENVSSRAYLVFKNEEDLAVFSREYDGHLFRDKAGKFNQGLMSC